VGVAQRLAAAMVATLVTMSPRLWSVFLGA